jgi:predicted metal-dependent phosphoesterase TrpH
MTSKGDRLIQVELHAHTYASKDSLVQPEKLLERCDQLKIDRIAITDHNVIETAFEMKERAPDRVIVGEEIATTRGEILGYFMTEWVPPRLEPMETIERLRSQGAVISLAHPFDTTRRHWTEEEILELSPYIDAIEVFNARCMNNTPNIRAAAFAQKNNLLMTSGSDVHSLWEVGQASMKMPDFSDAESFRQALAEAQQEQRLSPPFVHLFSRVATLNKKLTRLLK